MTAASMDYIEVKFNHHLQATFYNLSVLRNHQIYTDLTLSCEGQFYPAHRLVVSSCSEYLARSLQTIPPFCSHPIIILDGITSHILEILLTFMYEGVVTVHKDELKTIMAAGQRLGVRGMTDDVPSEDRPTSDISKTQEPKLRQERQLNPKYAEKHQKYLNTTVSNLDAGDQKFTRKRMVFKADEQSSFDNTIETDDEDAVDSDIMDEIQVESSGDTRRISPRNKSVELKKRKVSEKSSDVSDVIEESPVQPLKRKKVSSEFNVNKSKTSSPDNSETIVNVDDDVESENNNVSKGTISGLGCVVSADKLETASELASQKMNANKTKSKLFESSEMEISCINEGFVPKTHHNIPSETDQNLEKCKITAAKQTENDGKQLFTRSKVCSPSSKNLDELKSSQSNIQSKSEPVLVDLDSDNDESEEIKEKNFSFGTESEHDSSGFEGWSGDLGRSSDSSSEQTASKVPTKPKVVVSKKLQQRPLRKARVPVITSNPYAKPYHRAHQKQREKNRKAAPEQSSNFNGSMSKKVFSRRQNVMQSQKSSNLALRFRKSYVSLRKSSHKQLTDDSSIKSNQSNEQVNPNISGKATLKADSVQKSEVEKHNPDLTNISSQGKQIDSNADKIVSTDSAGVRGEHSSNTSVPLTGVPHSSPPPASASELHGPSTSKVQLPSELPKDSNVSCSITVEKHSQAESQKNTTVNTKNAPLPKKEQQKPRISKDSKFAHSSIVAQNIPSTSSGRLSSGNNEKAVSKEVIGQYDESNRRKEFKKPSDLKSSSQNSSQYGSNVVKPQSSLVHKTQKEKQSEQNKFGLSSFSLSDSNKEQLLAKSVKFSNNQNFNKPGTSDSQKQFESKVIKNDNKKGSTEPKDISSSKKTTETPPPLSPRKLALQELEKRKMITVSTVMSTTKRPFPTATSTTPPTTVKKSSPTKLFAIPSLSELSKNFSPSISLSAAKPLTTTTSPATLVSPTTSAVSICPPAKSSVKVVKAITVSSPSTPTARLGTSVEEGNNAVNVSPNMSVTKKSNTVQLISTASPSNVGASESPKFKQGTGILIPFKTPASSTSSPASVSSTIPGVIMSNSKFVVVPASGNIRRIMKVVSSDGSASTSYVTTSTSLSHIPTTLVPTTTTQSTKVIVATPVTGSYTPTATPVDPGNKTKSVPTVTPPSDHQKPVKAKEKFPPKSKDPVAINLPKISVPIPKARVSDAISIEVKIEDSNLKVPVMKNVLKTETNTGEVEATKKQGYNINPSIEAKSVRRDSDDKPRESKPVTDSGSSCVTGMAKPDQPSTLAESSAKPNRGKSTSAVDDATKIVSASYGNTTENQINDGKSEDKLTSSVASASSSDLQVIQSSQSVTGVQSRSQRILHCKICRLAFTDSSELLQHTLNHDSSNVFSCEHCSCTFVNVDVYCAHVAARHSPYGIMSCPNCKYNTSNKAAFERHLRSHTEK